MNRQKGVIPDATYQFFLSSIRSHWDPSALESSRQLAEAGLDWKLWEELAQARTLGPIVYRTLRGLDLLPAEVEQTLRQAYLWTAMRNSLLLDELGKVLDRLNDAGVSVMPIKGAALAETVYGNPAVRPMADLDILVPPADADVARDTLTDLGYTVEGLEPWPGYTRRYRHVLEFQRVADGNFYFLIDLHWGVVDVPYYEHIPINAWFDRAPKTQIGGVLSQIPTPEDHLLCLCGHLAFHERYSDDLLRYCDLAALICHAGPMLSWRTLLRRSADCKLVIPLQRALFSLEALWPGTVPREIGRKVAVLSPSSSEKRIHRWFIDRQRNPSSDVLLISTTAKGIRRKIRLLLEQAFPSPAYMQKRYDLQKSKIWPLYYIARFGLMILNIFDLR